MFKVLVNHNFTPDKEWIGDDYLIYDRSDDGLDHLKDFDQSKIIKTPNIGQVDYDKLNYLVDNYDNLPDVFVWGKTNLFKYISKEEYEKVKDNTEFTPLLTQNHKTYSDEKGEVCKYEDGMFYERNPLLYAYPYGSAKYFNEWASFAKAFNLPDPPYLPFAPGGNYILTKEVVRKHPKELYQKLTSLLPYAPMPLEAYLCERAYFLLWK